MYCPKELLYHVSIILKHICFIALDTVVPLVCIFHGELVYQRMYIENLSID